MPWGDRIHTGSSNGKEFADGGFSMAITDRVNAVKFSFDDVWGLHEVLEAENDQPNDPLGALDFSTRYFDGDRLKAAAFSMRMNALVELFETDTRIQAWAAPVQADGSATLQEPVFHALALCPLRAEGKRLHFDADEFFDLVLGHAQLAGAA
jgi:hypothetical protein